MNKAFKGFLMLIGLTIGLPVLVLIAAVTIAAQFETIE